MKQLLLRYVPLTLLIVVIGGVVALVMVLSRRATGSTRLAFGPPLMAGALAAVLLV